MRMVACVYTFKYKNNIQYLFISQYFIRNIGGVVKETNMAEKVHLNITCTYRKKIEEGKQT